MHQQQRETLRPLRLGLPVAMAEHAAAVRRVYLHRFRRARIGQWRAGQVIPNDGLQVPVAQAALRLKMRKPLRQSGGRRFSLLILAGF